MHHPGGHIQQEGRFGLQGLSIQLDPDVACLNQKELVQMPMAMHGDLPVKAGSAMGDRFNVQDIRKGAVFTIKVPDGNGPGRGAGTRGMG